MKRLVPVLLFAALPAAAVPTSVTYAGYLTQNGQPVNGPVSVVVQLFTDRTAGQQVFSESFPSLVVPDGDLVVELGLTTPLDDSILSRPQLWVQVTVEGEVLLPRGRLSSVPYALFAGEAETLEGLTAADIQAQTTALQNQINTLQSQLTALQGSLAALASAGGPPVAFANVTGLTFQSPLVFSNGNATVGNAALTSTHLANNSVTANQIATGAVAADEIAANAVTTAKIQDAAITTAKLADNAVTSAKVVNGTLVTADIATTSRFTIYKRNSGCGGDQTTLYGTDPGACTTQSCVISTGLSNLNRFRNCSGSCDILLQSAQTCPADQFYVLLP